MTEPADPLREPDWSRGPWEAAYRTRLIRQRRKTDCGVACLAMVAGIAYEPAELTFIRLGLHGQRREFSSNFRQLRSALQEHGLQPRQLRWSGWDRMQGVGILKVRPEKHQARHWHWVVAEASHEHGVIVRDPSSPLVGMERPPLDVANQALRNFRPLGCWFSIAP